MKPESKVIDSWAMVAWAQDEPVASVVEDFLKAAESGEIRLIMSILNVGETFYILAKKQNMAVAERFLSLMATLPVRVVVPDGAGVMAAARIKAANAVAYGDSFAIALAQAENASVITGDREIQKSGLVTVDWVGNPN